MAPLTGVAPPLPPMCTTVEHSRPAILNGADEPTPAIALDCSLAPKEGRSGDGLNRMRRDLRLSTERQDFSHVDLDEANSKADGPSASNGEATTTKTFRSRRLSTEAMGSATGKAKAKGATKGASTLSPRALLAKLDIGKHDAKEAHNPRLLIASEYEELSRSGGGKAAAVNGAAGSAGAWHLAPGIDSTTVGVLSCHGAEPSNSVTGQSAKINQDCACVLAKVGGVECAAIFCVYDGHGACGREVSTYAMRRMNAMLDEKHAELLKRRPHWALASAFNDVQDELRSPPPSVDVDAEHSGACALVAYMRERTLWVAGAGDTRAVLGTRSAGMLAAIALSTDHKVDLPSESSRIRAAGGHVKPANPPAPARIYQDARRLEPGLAIARALGDCGANDFGVIATPEVITHRLQPEDRFLIMASDGVWEFISASEAVEIVDAFLTNGKSVNEACHHLIATAAEAWLEIEGDYRDDITACIVWLQPVADALEKATAASTPRATK